MFNNIVARETFVIPPVVSLLAQNKAKVLMMNDLCEPHPQNKAHRTLQIRRTIIWRGLKNIQKTKIMASSPNTSWEIDGETVQTVSDFILGGSKITADGDCSHEIKRCLLLGRKVMTNLDSAQLLRTEMEECN